MEKCIKKMVTSFDVAKRAGVSQSTVSRAFCEGEYISEKVRKKVIDAANALGYRTNYINSGFHSKHSKLIGIVASINPEYNSNNKDMYVNNFAPLASSRLYSAVQETMLRRLHPIIMCVEKDESVDILIRQFLQYQLKGIIVTAENPSLEMARECKKHNIPMVLIQRDPRVKYAYHLRDSPEAVARLAFKMLSPQKGKKLGVLSCNNLNSRTIRNRLEAFQDYVTDQGYEVIVYESPDFSYQGFFELAPKIQQDIPHMDSIFGIVDYWSIATLDGLRAVGLDVPKDVQILGFDNKGQSSHPSVQLSTIEENLDGQSRTALDFIEKHYQKKKVGNKSVFQRVEPVYRKTTRKQRS